MKRPTAPKKKDSALAIMKALASGDYGVECFRWIDSPLIGRTCLQGHLAHPCAFCRACRFLESRRAK